MPPPMRPTPIAACAVEGCDRGGPFRLGYCALHRQRLQQHGTTELPRRMTVDERFDSKWMLDAASGCHVWQAGRDSGGYGQFSVDRKGIRAHVYAYVRRHGAVPDGLVLDHFVCDNKRCCNPDHLKPVTIAANFRRAEGGASNVNRHKTHCVNGHSFDAANTYIRQDNGSRCCRQCSRDRREARRQFA